MTSLFDLPEFNARLFFPVQRTSLPPERAFDFPIDLGGDVELHARIHGRPGTRGVLLLFHGNGEVVADYDGAGVNFASAGLDLVVVDYRGYGASTGEPTLRNTLADAPRVLEQVRARIGGKPLVVMGRSLGSACAAELCRLPREGVVAYVLESGIADLDAMVERRGLPGTHTITEADRATFDPLPKLALATTPTLVLHGARDTLVEPREAKLALQALGSANKALVMIPDRGHNDVSDHPVYWAALHDFVGRILPRR